jgi:hypothetical protein
LSLVNFKPIILLNVEKGFKKEIYEADLCGNAGRGRPKRTFIDQIGQVLGKGQVSSSRAPSVYEEFDESR